MNCMCGPDKLQSNSSDQLSWIYIYKLLEEKPVALFLFHIKKVNIQPYIAFKQLWVMQY